MWAYKIKETILRIVSIFKKIKSNGIKWFYRRLVLEYRIPQTTLGKKLKPMLFLLYRLLMAFRLPAQFFSGKNPLVSQTLYFFYDLEILPVTFNFSELLASANAYRGSLFLDSLYVIFVPGPYEGVRKEMDDYEAFIDKDARLWRKYHMLFPLTHLIPACSGFLSCASRFEAEQFRRRIPFRNIYPKNYTVQFPLAPSFYESARSHNTEVMAIAAPKKALEYIEQWLTPRALGRKTIVITLRQYNYMAKRNSNISAWAAFAKGLDPEKYFVVIVPDTETAMDMPLESLAGFEHCAAACWNIELRAALYESAYLNLGVNNGPFNLCWLNKKCRYIMFKIITEEVPQTTESALRESGFIPGTSPPFSLLHQKWVWEPDTQEVIEREFRAMCHFLEKDYK